MIEYQKVETAAVFPQQCNCGSSKGPFVDTMIEVQGRRWYVCKRCAKRIARPFAFMPGPEMDKYENISVEFEAKEKELAEAHRRNEKQTEANARLNTQIEEQKALVEHYRGLFEQQKLVGGIILENARELVSTANGGV